MKSSSNPVQKSNYMRVRDEFKRVHNDFKRVRNKFKRVSIHFREFIEIKFHEFYDNMKVIDLLKIVLENLESVIVNNYL